MKINIVENKVLSLIMQDLPDDDDFALDKKGSEDSGKVKSKFSIKLDFEEKHFFVTFDLKMLTSDGQGMQVKYKSKFVTDSAIDEEFISSNFPYVNAPAISYPFLRAFVSNLTLNAGYSPVMLPSVNFVALKEKTLKSNKQVIKKSH